MKDPYDQLLPEYKKLEAKIKELEEENLKLKTELDIAWGAVNEAGNSAYNAGRRDAEMDHNKVW